MAVWAVPLLARGVAGLGTHHAAGPLPLHRAAVVVQVVAGARGGRRHGEHARNVELNVWGGRGGRREGTKVTG